MIWHFYRPPHLKKVKMTNYERPVAYSRKARKYCVTLALLGYQNWKDNLWKFLTACAQQAFPVSSSMAAMKRFWKSEQSENTHPHTHSEIVESVMRNSPAFSIYLVYSLFHRIFRLQRLSGMQNSQQTELKRIMDNWTWISSY